MGTSDVAACGVRTFLCISQTIAQLDTNIEEWQRQSLFETQNDAYCAKGLNNLIGIGYTEESHRDWMAPCNVKQGKY